MNVQFRAGAEPASSVAVKSAIADCDIHPARATATELYPYLAKRWHGHLETYRKHPYQGMMEAPPYPKAQPNASRRDAWPPEGGPQGSSLSFMQKQHLDPNNVALGVLCPLNTGQGLRNQDLSAALATAINDWQIDKWTSQDSRLKGSIVVANEDGPAAAAEIRKRAGDKNFVQVLLLSRNVEPLGQRRYWPIYEAAEIARGTGRAAPAEIRKRAGDKNFVQVLLLSRNVEPLGQRRYWPIYEAAEGAGVPVGVHAFGV